MYPSRPVHHEGEVLETLVQRRERQSDSAAANVQAAREPRAFNQIAGHRQVALLRLSVPAAGDVAVLRGFPHCLEQPRTVKDRHHEIGDG
jgi:hypothetical protein